MAVGARVLEFRIHGSLLLSDGAELCDACSVHDL